MALSPQFYISLFSGAAGLDLAVRLAIPEARCVCFCEREIGAARILAARMEDGSLEPAPIWSDVCTFPCELFRDRVAGIVGGFPCTDLSVAGKRAGINGEHSGLWFEYLRIIRAVRPRWVFIENVPPVLAFPSGGIVLGGLAGLGFDAEWTSCRASDVGAPHKRKRVFIFAWQRGAQLEYALDRGQQNGWASGDAALRGGAMRNCDQRLRNQSAAWHTPHGMSGMDYSGKVGGGGEFAKQAANWPTPKENDGGTYSGVRNQERPFTTSGLSQSVRNWPSPRSEDSQVCGNHPGAMDSLGGGSASLDHPYQRKRQRSEPCAGGRGKPIGRRISLDHTSIPQSGGGRPQASETDGK